MDIFIFAKSDSKVGELKGNKLSEKEPERKPKKWNTLHESKKKKSKRNSEHRKKAHTPRIWSLVQW